MPHIILDFGIRKGNDEIDGFEIFTKGSKIENRVECSFVLYKNKLEKCFNEFRINGEESVSAAELATIYKSTHFINSYLRNRMIAIILYCDTKE